MNKIKTMKNKNLAKKVKDLRKRKGISQEELSENSNLSLRTIQRIENGESEPTGDSLKKISNALNITPDELIDWAEIEDNVFLKAMNLSALTFIFFPLLGIIVPLIMWTSKKDKLKNINKIGKDIINFEITWTLIVFTGFIINVIFLAKDFGSNGMLTPSFIISSQIRILIFLIIMYGLNILLILINTYKIHKNKEIFYYPKIRFIRN